MNLSQVPKPASVGGRGLEPGENPNIRMALLTAAVVVGLALVVLLGRLWYLQLLKGEHFRLLSENNRIRLVDLAPSRGLIFDAEGRLLADNRPAFTLAVIPEDVGDWAVLTRRLHNLVGLSPEEIDKARRAAQGAPPFKPVVLRNHLDRHQLALLETFRYELPGVKVLVRYQRAYLAPRLAAHVIGYLGEINKRELEQSNRAVYRMGDWVGRYGLEKSREQVLHGRRGARQVEVDAMGREIKLIKEVPASRGADLTLSINLNLQKAAAKALEGRVGAVAALDPRTGQVLCLYSSPAFDPNDFITGMSTKQWKELSEDPRHPLKDRAISGMYPPGSTYKIITSAAGLAEKAIDLTTRFFCAGQMPFGNRYYRCWAYKKGGHGYTDIHKAIRESCDVFFYKTGLKLGVDRLAKWARAFGLGRPTGISLPHESPGLVPDSKWKKKRFKERWQDGETLSLAIGQSFTLVTPLQMARMTAVVANGGMLVTPTLVKTVTPPGGEPVPAPEPVKTRVPIAPEHLDTVAKGLAAVVNEPHGTARRARLPGITVGGKTGTAQVVGLKFEKSFGDEENVPWKYRSHALFVAYAPVENPTIAVGVVVEHGGHGGSDAAPVAAAVMRAYFGIPEPPPKEPPKPKAAPAAQPKPKKKPARPGAGA
ncbi:MAG: penicillin-binding protein 2 [Desulfarculus sp.]|nr:penicillin-binding protein 2 [Pseudomonadota bacterium]MBV1715050.1 penicillin-binding protein 2 [Desulfarculus sp.]MBU4575118.1 penicillin-binding protein 2 [Pseudomonadota bacterium]MBU4599677.1 penicillin-binding protein 2 [Pseudomonadota bacterium]MBV1739906.1 penicillin-binding protein 2 [Desulfarculus sp.]